MNCKSKTFLIIEKINSPTDFLMHPKLRREKRRKGGSPEQLLFEQSINDSIDLREESTPFDQAISTPPVKKSKPRVKGKGQTFLNPKLYQGSKGKVSLQKFIQVMQKLGHIHQGWFIKDTSCQHMKGPVNTWFRQESRMKTCT